MKFENYSSKHSFVLKWLLATIFLPLLLGALQTTSAQTLGFERERGMEMLGALKNDIKNNYYDLTPEEAGTLFPFEWKNQ